MWCFVLNSAGVLSSDSDISDADLIEKEDEEEMEELTPIQLLFTVSR